jgi:hypothetical protein
MTAKRNNEEKTFQFFVKGKLVFETVARDEFSASRKFRNIMRNTASAASPKDLTIVAK